MFSSTSPCPVSDRQNPTEHHRTGERDRGDHEHRLECLADARDVDAHEDHVCGQVDPPAVGDAEQAERLDVVADEGGDRGRRDRLLDEDRRPGGETPHGPGARRANV
ncbi:MULTISPECIES: hypothetical protein [Pseudonocardia]|nr:hypothetical protein [Pseudonocardia saturnea]